MSVMETTIILVDGVGGRVETIYGVVFNTHLAVYGILRVGDILVTEVIQPLDGFTAVTNVLCKVILFFAKSIMSAVFARDTTSIANWCHNRSLSDINACLLFLRDLVPDTYEILSTDRLQYFLEGSFRDVYVRVRNLRNSH